MGHEIAKSLLAQAGSLDERQKAIGVAMSLGMPLDEIEEYLDLADSLRGEPLAGMDSVADEPPQPPAEES